jgi:hypothetical protein
VQFGAVNARNNAIDEITQETTNMPAALTRRTTPKEKTEGGVRPRMPRKPVDFRETEMARAIRAAHKQGLPVDRIEVSKGGGFVLHTGKLEITSQEDAAKQAWQRATEELQQTKPKQQERKSKRR